MQLKVSPIADTKEFECPWIEGIQYTVRRTGHPKAVDKEVDSFVQENEQLREESLRNATARAKEAGTPLDMLSLIKNDVQFTKEIGDLGDNIKEKEVYMQERMAAALLAGWKGEGWSKDERIGKKGFDAEFARKVFFTSLADDDLRIPRFRRIDDGEFVDHESDTYSELCGFVLLADKSMDTEKKSSASEEGEDTQAREVRIEKRCNKTYHDELKSKGFEEVPCYGKTLRQAWAAHIIANAAEVELSFNQARGILQRVS